MNTIEMITFLIIFIALVLYSYHSINKIEDFSEEKSNRGELESENTEFDYGHNINHKPEE